MSTCSILSCIAVASSVVEFFSNNWAASLFLSANNNLTASSLSGLDMVGATLSIIGNIPFCIFRIQLARSELVGVPIILLNEVLNIDIEFDKPTWLSTPLSIILSMSFTDDLASSTAIVFNSFLYVLALVFVTVARDWPTACGDPDPITVFNLPGLDLVPVIRLISESSESLTLVAGNIVSSCAIEGATLILEILLIPLIVWSLSSKDSDCSLVVLAACNAFSPTIRKLEFLNAVSNVRFISLISTLIRRPPILFQLHLFFY